MTVFQLGAILMTFVAVAGWINIKTINIAHGVAMLFAGIIGSLIFFAIESIWPSLSVVKQIKDMVSHIDFASAVLRYMLAFLLFAGSMQVDFGEMRRRWFSVSALATLGVATSVIVVGAGIWGVAKLLGIPLPLPWALVFGALISPTDPIAVLATVKHGRLPKSLMVILQGEALFNDGVGIVAFTALLALALGSGSVDPLHAILEVGFEALGGLVFGMAVSALAIEAMRTIDDFAVEVAMSIAIAMVAFAGAQAMGLSGAIAVVGAGLLFGGKRGQQAMQGETEAYLRGFWKLVDEILNALLFLLLGIEMLVVPFYFNQIGLLLAAIPLVLLARLIVVLPWGAYYRVRHSDKGAFAIMTWGGLHGALSLALALAIPQGPERALLLSVTYAVVAFSISVQGLTFVPLTKYLNRQA